MKTPLVKTILALSAFLLAGCGVSNLTGGNGSETTNGMVAYANGKPAAQASVRVVDRSDWLKKVRDFAPVVIDSATADDSGRFFLKTPPVKDFILQIDAAGEGILADPAQGDYFATGRFGTIALAPYASVRGSVPVVNGMLATVFLGGTHTAFPTRTDGSFTINNVPSGSLPIVVRRGTIGNAVLSLVKDPFCKPGDTVRADSIVVDDKSIPIDDFEDGDNRTMLGAVAGAGWWEAYSDSFNGGTSRLVAPVNGAPQIFATALFREGAPHNGCLDVRYEAGTQGALDPHSYPYVYVGFPLVTSGFCSLSSFDTLSFFAKGDGAVQLELIQQAQGVMVRAVVDVTLGADWTRYSITPADLRVVTDWFPAITPGLPDTLARRGLPGYTAKPTRWDEMRSAVNAIHFVCHGGTQCLLDDIRLHGVRLVDFVK
jgi:hypothetical protein